MKSKNILLILLTIALLLSLPAEARRMKEGSSFVLAEYILEQIYAVFSAAENPEIERDMDERLSQVRESFLNYLESLEKIPGLSLRGIFESMPKDMTLFSIATRSGAVPSLIDVKDIKPGLNIFPRQISQQGRSLSVEFILADADGRVVSSIVMSEKGSGYGWLDNAVIFMDEVSEFVNRNELDRPIFFGIKNRSIDIRSREGTESALVRLIQKSEDGDVSSQYNMVGGMYLGNAIDEAKKSRALWRLIEDINNSGLVEDSNRISPAVAFFERVNQLETISVGEEGGLIQEVPVEDYFTSIEYLSQSELLSLAYEAKCGLLKEQPQGYKEDVSALNRYIDLLWQDDYVNLIRDNTDLVDRVKQILKDRIELGIVTKWGDTELRLGRPSPDKNIEGGILELIKYIYFKYGEEMVIPEGEISYSSIYNTNKNNAINGDGLSAPDRIFREFARRLIATVGAVHGVGGYFPLDESILPKDVSITGEINDIAFVYLPCYGVEDAAAGNNDVVSRRRDKGSLNIVLAVFSELIYGADWRYKVGFQEEELRFIIDGKWQLPWMQETYEQYFNAAKELKTRGDI